MSQYLQLDPTKKDYVLSATGSSIPSDRVQEAAYYAIQIPQGQWLYGDPNQGSKLFTLNNVKRTNSTEQQIAGFISDAIDRQVISTGLAVSQSFQNLDATRTGTSNQLNLVPNQTQLSNQINFTAV